MGFEPMKEFPPTSKRAPSTTRPPLQKDYYKINFLNFERLLTIYLGNYHLILPLYNYVLYCKDLISFQFFFIFSKDENLSAENSSCAKVFNFNEISSYVKILLKCHPAFSNN